MIDALRAIEELASVGRFIGYQHAASRVDDLADALTHDRMVVGHEDSDRAHPWRTYAPVTGPVSLTVPVGARFCRGRSQSQTHAYNKCGNSCGLSGGQGLARQRSAYKQVGNVRHRDRVKKAR